MEVIDRIDEIFAWLFRWPQRLLCGLTGYSRLLLAQISLAVALVPIAPIVIWGTASEASPIMGAALAVGLVGLGAAGYLFNLLVVALCQHTAHNLGEVEPAVGRVRLGVTIATTAAAIWFRYPLLPFVGLAFYIATSSRQPLRNDKS